MTFQFKFKKSLKGNVYFLLLRKNEQLKRNHIQECDCSARHRKVMKKKQTPRDSCWLYDQVVDENGRDFHISDALFPIWIRHQLYRVWATLCSLRAWYKSLPVHNADVSSRFKQYFLTQCCFSFQPNRLNLFI